LEKQPPSPRIKEEWQLTCKHCYQDYHQECPYYNLLEAQRTQSCGCNQKKVMNERIYQWEILGNKSYQEKNDYFTLNNFEVINPDNVKKYYDAILLCKTCYHTQFEELEINDPKAEEYYKKEEINKLTKYNFCCKPIRKRQ
ncbi:34098_t:CDS:2, partial [Racocetra persica]